MPHKKPTLRLQTNPNFVLKIFMFVVIYRQNKTKGGRNRSGGSDPSYPLFSLLTPQGLLDNLPNFQCLWVLRLTRPGGQGLGFLVVRVSFDESLLLRVEVLLVPLLLTKVLTSRSKLLLGPRLFQLLFRLLLHLRRLDLLLMDYLDLFLYSLLLFVHS